VIPAVPEKDSPKLMSISSNSKNGEPIMSITFDQAVAQFLDPANTTQYSSLDAVKNLIPQISGEVFNPQTGSPSTAER